MDELRTRFQALDRIPVPNLWPDIERRADANAGSGMSRVTVRAGGSISIREAGPRRAPLGGLTWAALLALLLLTALALGGFAVGAWRLDDLRVLPVPRAELIEQPTGSMLVPRFDHSAVLLGDGRVLVTGGFVDRLTNPGSDTIAELFDPETGTFSTTGRMSVAREGAIAVKLSDGRVLVAGGSTSHPVDANLSAEVYDPGTGTFSGASPMAAKRTNAAAAVLDDGRVLIVGGDTDRLLGPLPLTAEIFDPGPLSFQAAGTGLNLALARLTDPFALTLDDGNVFIAGSAVEPTGGLPAPMLFDPSNGAVSMLPPIFVPDVASAPAGLAPSAVIDEGKVLFSVRFMDEIWRLLEFDPRQQSYRLAATLSGRPAADLVTIKDGRIVLIIEDPTDCSQLAANAFDPSDGSLREIGRIANLAVCGGESFTVTALANGGALIAGGDHFVSDPETVIVTLPAGSPQTSLSAP